MDAQLLGILAAIAALVALMAFLRKGPAMVKGRNRDKALWGGAIAMVILLMMGGLSTWQAWADQAGVGGGGDDDDDGTTPIVVDLPAACGTACPTDGETSIRIDWQNTLDTSAATEFDVSLKCITSGHSVTITDTTDPANASTFICGKEYTCYVASSSGVAGDSSWVNSILSGAGTISNGNLIFTACGSNGALQVGGEKHGVPEVRMWDMMNAGWVYDDGDATATDYESTDGVNFKSTTNNSTDTAVGTGGELHMKQYIRANTSYDDLNDRGILVLIDAASAKWDKPTVKIDGNTVASTCDSLDSSERIAYSDYEYCYVYTGDKKVTKENEMSVEIDIFALAGVNPADGDDISVDYAMRGQYVSTLNANEFKVGAVKDDSSKTQVYTLFDTVLDIT